jgi:hypothetical protein
MEPSQTIEPVPTLLRRIFRFTARTVRDKKLAESPCSGIGLRGALTERYFILPPLAQVGTLAAGLPPD